MEFKVVGDRPKYWRKKIEQEIFDGTNLHGELIGEHSLGYTVSDEVVFRNYLKKYKNIEIIEND